MPAGTCIVPLKPGSDGDYTHRPSDSSTYSIVDPPTLYLERLGLQWMQDRGEAKPRIKYILERLPVGYTLHERPRPNGIKDKYLFGHPSHKVFDSPNRFYPHFKHLMENDGDRIGCPCTVCDPCGGVLPGKLSSTSGYFSKSTSKSGSSGANSRRMSGASSTTGSGTSIKQPALIHQPERVNGAGTKVPYKPLNRPKMTLAGMDATRVDEEGTPDVYRNLINRLKRHGTLDEPIKEPLSLDWSAEQEIIPGLLRKLQRDPQWIPRVGDFLLYVRNVPEGLKIAHNPYTDNHELYDPQVDKFVGTAMWETGLVGQGPVEVASGSVGEDEWHVSQSGVRVEPLPNPNEMNKSLSKRYTYVPVENTCPFFFWEKCVGCISRDERHSTIQNGFTASATMSLLGKHRFRGTWPNAQIFCHAIYVGSELIAVGDTVRLAPKADDDDNVITDVLVVKTIRLKLSNLENASANDYDEGRPYNSEAWVYGTAYTTVASRSSKTWLSPLNSEVPKSASGYGDWYPLHAPDKELAVPFSRILGRLYEIDALQPWVTDLDLDSGREGVLDARKFASKNDKRIVSNIGTTWFWADSRADALDLQTVNGFDVGKHDIERDPKEWRQIIKKAGAQASERKPTLGLRRLKEFMAPASASSLPLRSVGRPNEEETSVSGNSTTVGSKRRTIEISDDEEEIRHQTRIVTNIPYKKSKVQVIVD